MTPCTYKDQKLAGHTNLAHKFKCVICSHRAHYHSYLPKTNIFRTHNCAVYIVKIVEIFYRVAS